MNLRATAAAFVFVLAFTQAAFADALRPAYLQLTQIGTDTYQVLWKVPAIDESTTLSIRPEFPPGTRRLTMTHSTYASGLAALRWTIRVPGGLEGKVVRFDGASLSRIDALARIVNADGTVQLERIQPGDPSLTVTGRPSTLTTARTFLIDGMQHILFGADHLLFVLGLLLIVKDRWMLVKTITAFTVAHSITLALATLGSIQLPELPLNAAIALSILFLGPEIVRSWRGGTSLTLRHPWVVAFAFGLLHGFGFASALTSAGLPHGELPLALFSFNVGVEIAQLSLVALFLLLERSFTILEIRWPRWAISLPGYTVGSLGAFWTLQRVALLVSGSP